MSRVTKAQREILFILNPKSGKRPWMSAAQIAAKRAGYAKAKSLGRKAVAAYVDSTRCVIWGGTDLFECHIPSTNPKDDRYASSSLGADLVRKRREREGKK